MQVWHLEASLAHFRHSIILATGVDRNGSTIVFFFTTSQDLWSGVGNKVVVEKMDVVSTLM